jgi:hypothetical protein
LTLDPTLLTSSYDTVDRTSYTTASVSPVGDRWLVVDSYARWDAGLIHAPTVTGLSLTWINEAGVTNAAVTHQVTRSYARTPASPGSGTILLSWGADTMDAAGWIVYQLGSDMDASDPFVQTATLASGSDGLSITVTLSAFTDGANRPLICASHRANEGSTPEAGYTEIGDVSGVTVGFAAASHSTTTDTSPSYSWATSASSPSLAIASEMKAGTPVSTTVLDPFGMAGFFGG